MLFRDMPVGTEFELSDDTGDYGPVLAYKLSESNAYRLGVGVLCGKRIDVVLITGKYTYKSVEYVNQDLDYSLTGNTYQVHDTCTELESVALALAVSTQILYSPLKMWVDAVASDPNEMRYDFQWVFENALMEVPSEMDGLAVVQVCAKYGYEFSPDNDQWSSGNNFSRSISKFSSDHYERTGERLNEEAVDELVWGIVDYRQRGRVSGEHTTTIMGMGTPLLAVQSSLAANVVEFHKRISEIIYFNSNN